MNNTDLIEKLRSCQKVAVFTGAGMSAESGIPTFRDVQTGLWAKFNPQEVASTEAFRKSPQLVWDWYVHRAEFVRSADPNPGHMAVAELQGLLPEVTVITQNIDNLHQRAGANNVLELHGSMFRLKGFVDPEELIHPNYDREICPLCYGYAEQDTCDPFATKADLAAIEIRAGAVPSCPRCGSVLRPDIVWFGEALDPRILAAAMSAADNCDLMICVGSSLEVQPAGSIPVRAKRTGATIIEINPEQTSLSEHADLFLKGKAAEFFPALVDSVWKTSDAPSSRQLP